MGTRIITLRLQDEQAEMLAMMAAEQGESLSAFLRGRIFARDSIETELHALQTSLLAAINEATSGVARSPESAAGGAISDPRLMGLLVEIVMLLRGMNPPTKVQVVRAEVERLGLLPFGSKT